MIQKVYYCLYSSFGPQGWWPLNNKHHQGRPKTNKRRFEVCIGAILTQNTAWKNVEKALANLIKNNLISPEKISRINNKKLAQLIRSAGYYNQKAKKLKIFSKYLLNNYSGNLEKMFKKSAEKLREELLRIHGIGPETADSIILYAAEKPVFVIDAYTKRLCSRLGICDEKVKYDDLQKVFTDNLTKIKNPEKKLDIFKEYHALIVELGKKHCRKKPVCKDCPITKLCVFRRQFDH